jgi:hypothetical protein
MRRVVAYVVLFCAVAGSGCAFPWTYEGHDDWWLRPLLKDMDDAAPARHYIAEGDALRKLVGCRALALIAAHKRRRGDVAEARAMTQELVACFNQAGDAVRLKRSIVGICVRDAGRGDPAATQFLRTVLSDPQDKRYRAGAAWTLAARDMGGTFADIKPAYDEALVDGDSSLAYELLGAMWLLGDAQALQVIDQAISEMEAAENGDSHLAARWPGSMHRVTREWYMNALRSRRDRLSAWLSAGGTP